MTTKRLGKVNTEAKDLGTKPQDSAEIFYTILFIILLFAIGLNFYAQIEERTPIAYAVQMMEGNK